MKSLRISILTCAILSNWIGFALAQAPAQPSTPGKEMVAAAKKTPTIVFPSTGYTIDALDPGPAQSGGFESMKMFLQPKDGFASNINIQHQAFSGKLKDFAALSSSQFKRAGLSITNEKIDESTYSAEAVGKVADIDIELHFYFRAIKSGENVILATVTIPNSRWETEKALLIPTVDSLKKLEK